VSLLYDISLATERSFIKEFQQNVSKFHNLVYSELELDRGVIRKAEEEEEENNIKLTFQIKCKFLAAIWSISQPGEVPSNIVPSVRVSPRMKEPRKS
jgi:membrane-bound lytic murein transglycosylase B